MINKFRLSANVYERETEDEQVLPEKIYFLSVEGNLTEKEYFDGISKHRHQLGINSRVNVETLGRSRTDTNSAPQKVIELLEEYLLLREIAPDRLTDEIPPELIDRFGTDFISMYIDNSPDIDKEKADELTIELTKVGYDLKYRQYLKKYNNEIDEFCILIDRDAKCHSISNMTTCIEHCYQNGYRCFIANPCFEFWLLLHLSDVKTEYSDHFEDIRENAKVSYQHTYVSKEVSLKAHHNKSNINFVENYLPNVSKAIDRAKDFAVSSEDLIENIGCNLCQLLEEMRSFS